MPSVSNAQTSIADVALLMSNQLPFLLLCPADAPPSIFLSAATLPWLCPCFLGELAPAPTSDVPSPSRPAPPPPWFPPCSDQICQVRPFCSPRPPHASTRAPPPVPAPLHRRPGRCRAPSPSQWCGQASRYQNSWIPNLRRMLMLTITACTQSRTFYRSCIWMLRRR
ncbi:vegetative cell wall protein gp1 [Zea mays]|uniref:vegetative cell wall protein gp1 n=1 Tax=Zea mays TaxID=4577 RepID=UPI000C6C70B5|nr:vegetative cell wall protein gp1 [Zea mays]|eukprot:XP_023156488.1 vegetative cell wall protein gp1-like [Zea mays]